MTALSTLPDDRYAVVLNANAGRVNSSLESKLKKLVPEGRLYMTQSQLHAREVLQNILDDDISTVFAGGGDGTIVDVINSLYELRKPNQPLPTVGALRLGTGNALAGWLGSGAPQKDLRQWHAKRVHQLLPVHMVEAEETRFPFAGLGIDAAILNDYYRFKNAAKGTWYEGMAKGMRGYLLAGYSRTLPNYIKNPTNKVRIVNLGRPAFKIGPNGREIGEPIPTGGTLYEGNASLGAAASTPYYGYGMKMFPFATMRKGRFQLRVINMTPFQAATNIWPAWSGKLVHPGLHDYYVDRLRVIFEDAVPYQLGGEAVGYRNEVTFSLCTDPIQMVRPNP
jgi:diacylglycerol kinase family enzyme